MQSYGSGKIETFGGNSGTDRPLGRSLARGWRCKCPACGNGRLFRKFLKPVDRCGDCGEDLHHQRSDDLPPYLSIFIVGHVVVAGYMFGERFLDLNSWQHLAIWVPIALVLAFVMMQPLKGAVIGLQWAFRMHGFGGEQDGPSDPVEDDGHR
jgi:uncharacterized protein (DUF983 family)